MGEGRLIGIARRAAPRAPMEALEAGRIGVDFGLEGDYRGRVRPGKEPRRQVTILAREDWDAACAELGRDVHWTARRANLFVERLDLRYPGAIVAIGEVRLEIRVAVDPCWRMDEAAEGLQTALRSGWRGGVGCRVLAGGEIALGDPVRLEDEA